MLFTLFPQLKGLDWNVKMTPEFYGLEAKGVSPGQDTEVSFGPDPLYHFECTYTVLRETGSFDERHILMNFFEYCRGKYNSFLVQLSQLTQRSADSIVVGQGITADSNGYAPIIVSRPYQNENIYEVAGVNSNPGTPPVVKINGVTKVSGTDYNILGPNVTNPTTGVTYPGLVVHFLTSFAGTLTIDMTWYYRVRFEQNTQEFSVFSYLLWEAQSVKMIGTRT